MNDLPSNCPICGSDNLFLYMKGIFDCENTEVLECCDCGLQFLNPMMSEEEEKEYYRNYYESQKVRRFQTKTLKNIQEDSCRHYEEYGDFYLSLLKDSESVLEIGSGTGGFLKFASENSKPINIVSVEKSEANLHYMQEECKGIFASIRFVNDISQIPEQKFDLIFAHGVLEHIRSPFNFLRTLIPFLKHVKGKMVLAVPNKHTAFLHIYDLAEFQKFTYMKQHYYTFSELSFHVLARQVGAVVEGFDYLQVWGLDNTLSWLRYRKPKDFSQFTKSLSETTVRSYKADMRRNGTTDLMLIILRQNNG